MGLFDDVFDNYNNRSGIIKNVAADNLGVQEANVGLKSKKRCHILMVLEIEKLC